MAVMVSLMYYSTRMVVVNWMFFLLVFVEKIKGPDNPTWEVNDVPFVWRSVSSHTALIFTATLIVA